jgi:WD40 repeat protein
MAHSKNDVKTMKDRKVMSWSPDYTLLACPNLNDSKVSTIAVFDREKDFSVKNILIGHKTPVNCMKFSPYIYEY